MRRSLLLAFALLALLLSGGGWLWTWQLAPRRAALAWLAGHWFLLSMAVGALALLMIVHATRALWAIPLRRLLEPAWTLWALSALTASGLLPLAAQLFPWAGAGAPHELHLQRQIAHHAPWFAGWWPQLRAALILLVGLVPALVLARWSRRQDQDPQPHWQERMRRLSAAGLPLVGLAATAACLDWLFALQPHFHSTIFGVLVFAGGAQAALALWILGAWIGHRAGLQLGRGQWYALGTLLVALSCFWAYCQFSQALVIFMGDLPPKVPWLLDRREGWWGLLSLLLVLGRFALPFLLLLTVRARCHPGLLATLALPLLPLHALECLWWVVPMADGGHSGPAWADLAALAAVLAAVLLALVLAQRRGGWAPRGDPRQAAALRHFPGPAGAEA